MLVVECGCAIYRLSLAHLGVMTDRRAISDDELHDSEA
jgi:hypothetical protein